MTPMLGSTFEDEIGVRVIHSTNDSMEIARRFIMRIMDTAGLDINSISPNEVAYTAAF